MSNQMINREKKNKKKTTPHKKAAASGKQTLEKKESPLKKKKPVKKKSNSKSNIITKSQAKKKKPLSAEQEFKQALKNKNNEIKKNQEKEKKVSSKTEKKGAKYKTNKKTKSKNKTQTKSKAKGLLKKIVFNSIDLIPYKKKIDKGETGFLMKNDYYVNVFSTSNHDYPNLSENNVRIQIGQWEKFYKTIGNTNIKKIFLSLPIDTREHQEYYKRKLKNATEPAEKRILKESIKEFQMLKDIQFKQEFMFIITESIDELNKYNKRVRTILCYSGLCSELTVKEKVNVLRKLNNPFSTGLITE